MIETALFTSGLVVGVLSRKIKYLWILGIALLVSAFFYSWHKKIDVVWINANNIGKNELLHIVKYSMDRTYNLRKSVKIDKIRESTTTWKNEHEIIEKTKIFGERTSTSIEKYDFGIGFTKKVFLGVYDPRIDLLEIFAGKDPSKTSLLHYSERQLKNPTFHYYLTFKQNVTITIERISR